MPDVLRGRVVQRRLRPRSEYEALELLGPRHPFDQIIETRSADRLRNKIGSADSGNREGAAVEGSAPVRPGGLIDDSGIEQVVVRVSWRSSGLQRVQNC